MAGVIATLSVASTVVTAECALWLTCPPIGCVPCQMNDGLGQCSVTLHSTGLAREQGPSDTYVLFAAAVNIRTSGSRPLW